MNSNEKIKRKFMIALGGLQKKISDHFGGKHGNDLLEEIVLYFCKGAISSVYAFLLSACSTLFSAYPLGIAFLSSSCNNVIFKYIGCIFASFTLPESYKIPYLIVYTGVLLLRFAVSKFLSEEGDTAFSEDVGVRAVIALIAAFSMGLYTCISELFTLHSLGALVFSCGICLCLGYVFAGVNDGKNLLHTSLARYSMAFCLIYSISEYSIFGFSLGFSICSAISLFVSQKKDMLNSAMISLFSGLACNTPVLAPMFAIMSLTSSVVQRINTKFSLASGVFAGALYSFWIYGTKALWYVLPDLICGALILIPVFYFGQSKKNIFDDNKMNDGTYRHRDILEKSASKKDSLEISGALSSLASMLDELSKTMKSPFLSDLNELCEKVYADHCSLCEKKCSYFSGEKKEDNLCRMSASLFENGYLKKDDLPRNFYDKCDKGRNIISKTNKEYGELLHRLITNNNSETLSESFSSVSKLIKESVAKRESDFSVDESLSASLKNEAQTMKLRCEDVYIYGNRKKTIICEGLENGAVGFSGNKLKERFSAVINSPLSAPFIESDGDHWRMKLDSLPIIGVEAVVATRNCEGEEVCGDSINTFNSNDGYFYSILSDGMGSGVGAALASRICCAFAEKLLSCGGTLKTVIESINGYILNRTPECSATLDLLRVDKYTSKACFVKCGAVSSMVIRGGHVFKINSSSVPVGVIRELNSEVITLPLIVGDYIIMNSDGVTPDFESGLLTADIVTKGELLTLEEIAKAIIDSAESSSRRSDDMSVVVIKITGA